MLYAQGVGRRLSRVPAFPGLSAVRGGADSARGRQCTRRDRLPRARSDLFRFSRGAHPGRRRRYRSAKEKREITIKQGTVESGIRTRDACFPHAADLKLFGLLLMPFQDTAFIRAGFEPTSSCLSGRCSPPELTDQLSLLPVSFVRQDAGTALSAGSTADPVMPGQVGGDQTPGLLWASFSKHGRCSHD